MTKYAVFVLGETGRSPRMQYHALSLSKIEGAEVRLLGIKGPKCHPLLLEQSNIIISEINSNLWNWIPLRILGLLSFLVLAPLKVILQILVLFFWLLKNIPADTDFILIQTPPAIPTLFLMQIICFFFRRRAKLVIDWHNFGYSLISPSKDGKPKGILGKLFIGLAYYVEKVTANLLGRSKHHFCVSKAMKETLRGWNIDAKVLYDRPPSIFTSELSLEAKHKLFMKLFAVKQDENEEVSTFSRRDMRTGELELLEDRPALLVSSTSWTPDEDFSVLLDAIIELDKQSTGKKYHFVITGKGPQREYYEKKMATLDLKHCKIETKWLEAADYPKLLSCCDLGICLHYSSSGVDLPMKVVDMFGSSLPVVAVRFQALPELVLDGQNGLIFDTPQELCEDMKKLLADFPKKQQLSKMSAHIRSNFQKRRWDDEWKQNALPVFSQ